MKSRAVFFFGVAALLLACGTLLLAQEKTSGPWIMQSSGTTAGLRGIHTVGGGVAWASGTGGTVLRTEDGGYMWQRCGMPPEAEKLDFRGIWAWDADTAVVMSSGPGDQSRIYKTTDGCSHWKLLFTNPDKDGFWDAMGFITEKPYRNSRKTNAPYQGFLVGDPVNGSFLIYATTNSGETWHKWIKSKSYHPVASQPGESLFAASDTSILVPGSNGPFAFVTGGKSGSRLLLAQYHSPFDAARWLSFTVIPLRFPAGADSGAFSIASRRFGNGSRADLMIVGGDYSHPNEPGNSAFVSGRPRIGGMHNTQYPTKPPHGFRSAVAWDADAKAWIAAGTNGSDISYDDGKTWAPLDNGNWNALSLPWIVGPHGRIARLDSKRLPKR